MSERPTSSAKRETPDENREMQASTVHEFPHLVTSHEPHTATALRIAVPVKRDEVTANIDLPHILRPVRKAGDNRQGRHWLFTVVIAGSIAAALFAGAA